MISIRVKYFSRPRRCSAVQFCIGTGTVHSFYIAKYIFTETELMPSFSMWVAWHLIHSDRGKKKWFQTICSIFCWMLTAGSDVFHFWPCEMLSCLCNALYIKYTNCNVGFSCLHKDILLKTNVQVSFTNAIFLLLFYGMRHAWYMFLYFKCDAEKSCECFLFQSVMKNIYKLLNQLIFLVIFMEYCFYYCYLFIII